MQPAKLDGWSRSAIGFPHIIVTEKEHISKLPLNQSLETQFSLLMDGIGKYNAVEKNYLNKHLKRREKIKDDKSKEEPAEQDDDDDYDPSEPLSSVVDISAAVKSKKSKVWNFFTRLEKDVARCKSCEVTIKTQKGNTTGMTRHLFRAHSDMYNQLEVMKQKDNDSNGSDDDDDEDFSPFKGISLKSGRKRKKGQQASKSTRKRANQKRSKVWQFFDQQADGTEARCNACMIMIKTDMGNTSGLISHLRSSHPEQFEELSALREGGGGDEPPASTSGARNSPVWQFYEELGSNRVKCIKCNVVLKYYYGTTSGLLRHLRRSHAEAYDAIKNDDNSANANNAENVGGAPYCSKSPFLYLRQNLS